MAAPLLIAGRTAATVTSRFWPIAKSLGGSLTSAIAAEYAVNTAKDGMSEEAMINDVASNPTNVYPFVAAVAKHLPDGIVSTVLTDLMDSASELKISKEVLSKLTDMMTKVSETAEKSTGDGDTETIWGQKPVDVELALTSFGIAKNYIRILMNILGIRSVSELEKFLNAIRFLEPAHLDLAARHGVI